MKVSRIVSTITLTRADYSEAKSYNIGVGLNYCEFRVTAVQNTGTPISTAILFSTQVAGWDGAIPLGIDSQNGTSTVLHDLVTVTPDVATAANTVVLRNTRTACSQINLTATAASQPGVGETITVTVIGYHSDACMDLQDNVLTTPFASSSSSASTSPSSSLSPSSSTSPSSSNSPSRSPSASLSPSSSTSPSSSNSPSNSPSLSPSSSASPSSSNSPSQSPSSSNSSSASPSSSNSPSQSPSSSTSPSSSASPSEEDPWDEE